MYQLDTVDCAGSAGDPNYAGTWYCAKMEVHHYNKWYFRAIVMVKLFFTCKSYVKGL
jgi:hypothetical protein